MKLELKKKTARYGKTYQTASVTHEGESFVLRMRQEDWDRDPEAAASVMAALEVRPLALVLVMCGNLLETFAEEGDSTHFTYPFAQKKGEELADAVRATGWAGEIELDLTQRNCSGATQAHYIQDEHGNRSRNSHEDAEEWVRLGLTRLYNV